MHVKIWEGKSDKSQAKLRDYKALMTLDCKPIVGSDDYPYRVFRLTRIQLSSRYRWPAEWLKKTAQLLQRMKWPRLRLRSCCPLANDRYSSHDHGRDGEAFAWFSFLSPRKSVSGSQL